MLVKETMNFYSFLKNKGRYIVVTRIYVTSTVAFDGRSPETFELLTKEHSQALSVLFRALEKSDLVYSYRAYTESGSLELTDSDISNEPYRSYVRPEPTSIKELGHLLHRVNSLTAQSAPTLCCDYNLLYDGKSDIIKFFIVKFNIDLTRVENTVLTRSQTMWKACISERDSKGKIPRYTAFHENLDTAVQAVVQEVVERIEATATSRKYG